MPAAHRASSPDHWVPRSVEPAPGNGSFSAASETADVRRVVLAQRSLIAVAAAGPGHASGVVEQPRYPAEGLVPYDPRWPTRYAELASRLHRAVGYHWRVEHIGSTAVPGLLAKPVIDLAVRVSHSKELEEKLADLEAIGWTDLTSLPTHRALYQLDDHGVRRAIAHLFSVDQWATAPQRLFPAWLRSHPADRDQYAALKQALRDSGTWGHDYTAAKAAFVNRVCAKAAAARDSYEP